MANLFEFAPRRVRGENHRFSEIYRRNVAAPVENSKLLSLRRVRSLCGMTRRVFTTINISKLLPPPAALRSNYYFIIFITRSNPFRRKKVANFVLLGGGGGRGFLFFSSARKWTIKALIKIMPR